MKIVLKEPGFENYTGQFGVNTSVHGKSVEDGAPHDAVRISAVMKAEWENGVTPTAETEYSKLIEATAPGLADPRTAADPAIADAAKEMSEAEKELTEALVAVEHTQETLGALADKEGIAGLRKIADGLGVKAQSISDLIEKILKKQAEAQAAKE